MFEYELMGITFTSKTDLAIALVISFFTVKALVLSLFRSLIERPSKNESVH